MSKFFKALEQAERERALRAQGEPPSPSPVIDQPEPEPPSEVSGEFADGVEEHLVSLLTPASFEAEQYRALRHLVEQRQKSATCSIIGVSSPAVGDGKTITAINLAGALAQASEARVLLVDADLRRSSLAAHLALGDVAGRGLVGAILDPRLTLDDVARRRSPFNLSVLPAGRGSTAQYELLKSPRLGELLEEARRQYDYIVLDTPPLVPIPDCRVVGKWVDGFLVVVAAHKTPRKLLEEALRVVDPAKIVGLVFNSDDHPLYGYYSTYYDRSSHDDGAGWWARMGRSLGGALRRRSAERPGIRHRRKRWR